MEFSSDRFKKLAGIITEAKTEQLTEDWDNYLSVDEIEMKYFQKILYVLNDVNVDDYKKSEIREIFKTALKDAELLGKKTT